MKVRPAIYNIKMPIPIRLWLYALFLFQLNSRALEPPVAVSDDLIPKFRLSHFLGVAWFRGSGLAVGVDTARRYGKTFFYYGGEVHYLQFPKGGGVLSTLGRVSFEKKIGDGTGVILQTAISIGPAFNRKLTGISSVLSAVFADVSISKDVDDLASFCFQIRPGFLGKDPVLMATTKLAFRFF